MLGKAGSSALVFCLSSAVVRETLSLLSHKATKNAVTPYPRSLGQWPTAPSVDSVHIICKYRRPSVVYSLLHAESDITAQALAYSLSGNIVKVFLCHLSNYCQNGSSKR